MKYTSPLISLGLHADEVIIYETLIIRGALSPTELCRHTKLHRPSMYKFLDALLQKNLASIVPSGKRNKYVANSPKRLQELSKDQEKRIEGEIIRLEEKVELPKNVPEVVVRNGVQAIKTVYEEMIQEMKKGDVYYRYASLNAHTWTPGKYITAKSKRLRDAKQLQRYIITNQETKSRKRKDFNRDIKVVPQKFDLLKHNVGQMLYNNKVVIIDYNTDSVVIIENKNIAEFQKVLFRAFFYYL